MLDTFPDRALRLFLLLALVTLAGCATNVPIAQLSTQPAIGPGAPSQPLHTSALDTCPDGLVVLMQSTASQAPPYKVSYRRQPDGCYVTRDLNGQSMTARAFFGAVHLHEVRNPSEVEAGFEAVLLDGQNAERFTIQTSRGGVPFNSDVRLLLTGRDPYHLGDLSYPSWEIDCTTTVIGRQYFENTLTFSLVPGTKLLFLSRVTSKTPSSVWGSEKVIRILSPPQLT
jgi:hypothetical protein